MEDQRVWGLSAVELNIRQREEIRQSLRELRSWFRKGGISWGYYNRERQAAVYHLENLRAEAEIGLVDRPRLSKPSKPSGVV